MDPKKKLKREVRPAGLSARAPFRTYEEADSEDIAHRIVDGGWLQGPQGTSQSWSAFVAAVGTI